MSDNVSNRRISNKKEHSFPIPEDAGSSPRFGAGTFTAPHDSTPTPVDKEGMTFLTKEHIGPIYGRSAQNAKRVAWETAAPHYTFDRGNFRPENASVYYSHGEIVNHLATLAGGATKPDEERTHEERGWARVHAIESEKYKAKKKDIAASRKAGGPVFNLENQPHPGNKNFATSGRLTHYPKGREEKVGETGTTSFTSDRRVVQGVPVEQTKSRTKRRSL
jgi:hypothetical protein